ncbi:MAG: Wzz/FepE/Etk N-terminal domain-containing protein [Gammaproteobacteria bacterium]
MQRVVQTHEGEIGVREFIIIAWQSRWLIVAITLLGVLLGLGSTFVLTKKYTATVLLSPVSNQSSSGLGALGGALSQLGGVASLAGLSLGSSNSARSEAIATLQSEALTTQYIQDNGLLPVLFSDKWDAAHSRWATKTGKAPSLWLGNALFESRVRSVTENAKSGLVSLTITWSDPKMAAAWANGLVQLTNNYMRNKAIEESRRNIAYLNEQAGRATIVELRSAIFTLMESEIKKEMMARGSSEYALKVIDPAVPSEVASFPRLLLMVAGGFLIGAILGLLAAAVRFTLRRRGPITI